MDPNREKKLMEFIKNADKKLITLWNNLCDKNFLYQEGPYPASHGKNHILNVLWNLRIFLESCDEKFQDEKKTNKINLIAATMIHDILMIRMRSQGSENKKGVEERQKHASLEDMKKLAEMILKNSGFEDYHDREDIILIASSHAKDPHATLDEKMLYLKDCETKTGKIFLVKSAVLLQISDFFDIGVDRLALDTSEQDWNEDQIEHYKKHKSIGLNINKKERQINLWLNRENEVEVKGEKNKITPMEKFKIIHKVNDEACMAINKLNDTFNPKIKWRVGFDRTILGEITPMGKGFDLFTRTMEKALKNWEVSNKDEPFPVYKMGHSLYGRFFDDEEKGLNERLRKTLKSSGMDFRVLILDPGVENQQMREVYGGQLHEKQEKRRSIIPRYDNERKVCENGDILSSLEKLREWLEYVGYNSSMEVRATTRLMYMSIARFGNTLIVTPYRQKGLFNESFSIVFKNQGKGDFGAEESPLYNAFLEVFEDIWEDRFETTLQLYKNKRAPDRNPIVSFIPNPKRDISSYDDLKPLDYERYFLHKYSSRIKSVFDYIDHPGQHPVIPPIEVEIQPSEECTLSCEHCIGRHVNQKKEIVSQTDKDFFPLLNFNDGGYKIERFRISGSVGDPLSKSGRDTTLHFIEMAQNAKREVVLLTNGTGLTPHDSRLLILISVQVETNNPWPSS